MQGCLTVLVDRSDGQSAQKWRRTRTGTGQSQSENCQSEDCITAEMVAETTTLKGDSYQPSYK